MRSIRVHPRLRACLGWSFTIMGSVFALLLIADAAKGRLTWDKAELAIKIVCLIGAGIGLFLYGIGFVLTTTVNEKGLRGPSGWVRRTIYWNDIGSVRRVVVKGIPYLLIQSRSSKKEIWFCVLGFNERPILERLQNFIPASDSDKVKGNSL
jgi:hypothetical protein